MDDKPTTLEQRIGQLPRQQPSRSLDQRIMRQLRSQPTWRDRNIIASIATIGSIAACLAVAFGSYQLLIGDGGTASPGATNHASTAVSNDRFKEDASAQGDTVRIDEVYSQMVPGQLVLDERNQPMRPVQMRRLQHSQWINEAEEYRIEMTVPVQETVYVQAPVR